jgi:pyruvyl transferase EpsO
MTPTDSSYIQRIQQVISPLVPDGAPLAFFDIPNNANVGDSALWLGQIEYFSRAHPRSSVIWHSDLEAGKAGEFPTLPRNCVICISGGGNFGDLWPLHQQLREQLVQRYPAHSIIQLPQSIHFNSEKYASESARVLASHAKFHLLVRDRPSVFFAQEIMGIDAQLCPDMALSFGRLTRPTVARLDVLLLMRQDGEKAHYGPSHVTLPVQSEILDWLDDTSWYDLRLARRTVKLTYSRTLGPSSAWINLRRSMLLYSARRNLQRGMKLLSRGRVVVTDRLHAHILCTLMHVPHVVLDNSYGKIERFRSVWETGKGICLRAQTLDEALHCADELLRVHTDGL